MTDGIAERILATVREPSYQPIKAKALARKLGVETEEYGEFRQTLKGLIRDGKLELGPKNGVRAASQRAEVVGVFKSVRGGGIVRPRPGQGVDPGDVFVKARYAGDAASGDVVLVALGKRGRKGKAAATAPKGADRLVSGRIVEILERASQQFVGTYRVRDGEGLVVVDGGVFREEIYVGDAGAKGAQPGDKVVIEMLRFPSPQMFGEAVVTEVLGPRGEAGVDLLSVIRQYQLPDTFDEEVLADARAQARQHEEQAVGPDRVDHTQELVVTIDPPDARDFDDAITVSRDEKGFWTLWVHIADASTFVPPGSPLDRCARERGTSVYLHERVLPMLPEIISNGLASLQQGRVRYTKSVRVEFSPEGQPTVTDFQNTAIRVRRRLTYEQVQRLFDALDAGPTGTAAVERMQDELGSDVVAMLEQARELARILRQRRVERGFLALDVPKPEIRYDEEHGIKGAEYTVDDESHQLIEAFMVTANEAVARKLTDLGIAYLRRIHESPDPMRLRAFGQFVRSLGLEIEQPESRFELQRILDEVAGTPQRLAVGFALLRSLKLARYGPEEEGHYALASDAYCHFTSPIRRYPDLAVHRQLDRWLREGKAGSDQSELIALGEHCSFTERRAEKAERELTRIRLLAALADEVGETLDMVITGVEEYGFFAQGIDLPAEGLVHIRTLTDDFYHFDRDTHTLAGRRSGNQFRLGDKVRCVLWRVDQEQRQIDLRLAEPGSRPERPRLKGPEADASSRGRKPAGGPRRKIRVKRRRRR